MNNLEEARRQECYSCAMTLSDMEIFIFPELMYALVFADILSPEIWKWREDPWFKDIERKNTTYRINRVKQYIMDHFVFNLDLETWGLSTKDREINRFRDFIDPDALAQSNALFGYQGDKYYYDVDIRRHFGLDKYNSDVIPYWKTETVEAMQAFRRKEGYRTGAGECVSLSALYVAALFVVGRIPLEDMFMIGTPLHSQNFLAEKDGLMTNNRRVVTKKMWYNGTELSAKARRSVENERITLVAHISGVIHTFYKRATMEPERYRFFEEKFRNFLCGSPNFETFANFLYSRECYWNCFQYRHRRNGRDCFISMPCIFNTQRNSKNRFDNESRAALLEEIDGGCFALAPYPGKTLVNDIETWLNAHKGLPFEACAEYLRQTLDPCPNRDAENFLNEWAHFLKVEPRLPKAEEKQFEAGCKLRITPEQRREEIRDYLYEKAREGEPAATLALYAYRDMTQIDWNPFIKAAVERNPVSVAACREFDLESLYERLREMEATSIYEGPRLAQPDEVWNFQCGDGLEKAFLFWNVFKARFPDAVSEWKVGKKVEVLCKSRKYKKECCPIFDSAKGLEKSFRL